IESLLFVRLRINNRVVKRECRLLGDRFEDDKIVLRERGTHSAVGKSEHPHVLFRVEKRRHHYRSRAERTVSQRRQFRCFGKFIQTKRRGRLPYAPEHSLAVSDIVNPKRTFQPANASALSQERVNPRGQTGDQQPEKNGWPHEIVASLLPRRRLMKVLF